MKRLLATLVAWGPLGVFIVGIVDGVGVPSPGGLDWMLLLLCVNRPQSAYTLAAVALLGSLIGCSALFYLARRGGEATLKKYRGRPRFERFENWFQRYGLLTVFIPALVPIPMPLKFFIICAGVFEVPPLTFLAVMLAARIPRFLGLSYLGSQLGRESFPWLKTHAWAMAGVATGLFAFLYLLILIADKRRKQAGIENARAQGPTSI